MSITDESIRKLRDLYSNNDNALWKEFKVGVGDSTVVTESDLKKVFKSDKRSIDRYVFNTLLQCRIYLDLTDKSKYLDFESTGISIMYSVKESYKSNVYNILVLKDGTPILYKKLIASPSTYVPIKNTDTQKNMGKAVKEFSASTSTSIVGGTTVVGTTVTAVKAIKTGTSVVTAVGGGVVKKGAVTVATTALGTAATTAGATLAATGTTAGIAVAGGLTVVGGVLTAPITAPIIAGVATFASAVMLGRSIKTACTYKSKSYRFSNNECSVISYMILKQSDSDTDMKFAYGVDKKSILFVSIDKWCECIDQYRMYPLPTKNLIYDDYIGLFATSPTGWARSEEELKTNIDRFNKLTKTL